jgi:hypothetical protein
MKKLVFTILLSLICDFNISAQSKATKEEYEVYAGVFEHIFQGTKPNEHETFIAVSKSTVEPSWTSLEGLLNYNRISDDLYGSEIGKAGFENLLRDFKETNKNLASLENEFSIGYKYGLITKNELETLLEQGKKENAEYYKKCEPCAFHGNFTWQPFHRKYRNSNGYYSFSRVGFSDDKKFALVFVKLESGDQGFSNFYVLRKSVNKWQIFKFFGSGWIN